MHLPKPAASLTAGLLARKGGARPAMRRQTPFSPDLPAVRDVDDRSRRTSPRFSPAWQRPRKVRRTMIQPMPLRLKPSP